MRLAVIVAMLALLALAGCEDPWGDADCVPEGYHEECAEYVTHVYNLWNELCEFPCINETWERPGGVSYSGLHAILDNCRDSCYPGIDRDAMRALHYEKAECVKWHLVRDD